MDFQTLLFEVGRDLSNDEVKALAFLCTDLLGRNPSSVQTCSELFSRLQDQDHLSADRPQLLTELLLIIQRNDLVRVFSLSDQASSTLICPYRKLLYELSEEMTDHDLKDVKFLLNKKLPRRKLEEHITTLEVFLEMEHMDLINNNDLNMLETLLQSICPTLKERINRFKAQQGTGPHGPVVQETCQPASMSPAFRTNRAPHSLDVSLSCEIREARSRSESTTSPSIPSVDFLNASQSRGDDEALSSGVTALSFESSSSVSSEVRSDALVIRTSSENNNSSHNRMSQTTKILGTYPMTAAKRGTCLIVNNYDFNNNQRLQKREGTGIDKECLQKVFTWLGFEVEIHEDCDSQKMLSVVQELSRRDHSQMDCLVCFFLSHGKQETVHGVDGNTVRITELMEPFSGVNCASLAEKPKLFFIQACQGTSGQRPVYIQSDGPTPAHREPGESIPEGADFLLAMATVPSYASFRDRRSGTWFIQSLCQNLVQMVPSGSDLMSILTQVNADVSEKWFNDSGEIRKQMPQPSFTLRKKVVFPIPANPPPDLIR